MSKRRTKMAINHGLFRGRKQILKIGDVLRRHPGYATLSSSGMRCMVHGALLSVWAWANEFGRFHASNLGGDWFQVNVKLDSVAGLVDVVDGICGLREFGRAMLECGLLHMEQTSPSRGDLLVYTLGLMK